MGFPLQLSGFQVAGMANSLHKGERLRRPVRGLSGYDYRSCVGVARRLIGETASLCHRACPTRELGSGSPVAYLYLYVNVDGVLPCSPATSATARTSPPTWGASTSALRQTTAGSWRPPCSHRQAV